MIVQKKIALPLLAAVLVVAGAGLYRMRHSGAGDAAALVLQGNVDMRQVSLAFNGSGRIASLAVHEGEVVRQGQLLGELDAATLQLQVQQAQAQLAAREQLVRKLQTGARPQEIAQASASVRSAQAELQLAHIQLARMQAANSGSLGDAVSKMDIDNARARVEMAQARVDAARQAHGLLQAGARKEDIAEARAQQDAGRAQLDLLQRQLADTRLQAPSAGTIRSRLQEVGDLTTPQKPVYALALTDAKWVRVYVPEPSLGRIRPGMPASIRIDSAPQQPLAGRVGYIASVAEFTPKAVQTEELRSSLVYEVRVQAEDPQDRLRLGMPATVTLDMQGNAASATIPAAPAASALAASAMGAASGH